jgi:hypothetical protein
MRALAECPLLGRTGHATKAEMTRLTQTGPLAGLRLIANFGVIGLPWPVSRSSIRSRAEEKPAGVTLTTREHFDFSRSIIE